MKADINPSSSHGSRVENLAALGARYGDALRAPGFFTESELDLLDEYRRTSDSESLMDAAGEVRRPKTIEEKLTRIAERVRERVPEVAGLKRDRVLATAVAILESKTVTREDGTTFVARSTEHWPEGWYERRRRSP